MSWNSEYFDGGELYNIDTSTGNPTLNNVTIPANTTLTIRFLSRRSYNAKALLTIDGNPATLYVSEWPDIDSNTGLPKYRQVDNTAAVKTDFIFYVQNTKYYYVTIQGKAVPSVINGYICISGDAHSRNYLPPIYNLHDTVEINAEGNTGGRNTIVIPFTSKYTGRVAFSKYNHATNDILITESDTGINKNTGYPNSPIISWNHITGCRANVVAGLQYYAYIVANTSSKIYACYFNTNSQQDNQVEVNIYDQFGRRQSRRLGFCIKPNPYTGRDDWQSYSVGMANNIHYLFWDPLNINFSYGGTLYMWARFDHWEVDGTYYSSEPCTEWYTTSVNQYITINGYITLMPNHFAWTTPKVSEGDFHLTKTEWNDYCCYCLSRVSPSVPPVFGEYILGLWPLSDIHPELAIMYCLPSEANAEFTAKKFWHAKMCADCNGTLLEPTTLVLKDDIIYASYFQNLFNEARYRYT